jgi:mannitol 2-dehydrogenase
MKLTATTRARIGDRGVDVPDYDRQQLTPSIVHIGVGGFHRAHLATYVDELCRRGHTDWGITGAGVLPGDARMAEVLREQDHLYTLMVRDDGVADVRVIGSILDYVHAHPDPEPLIARIADPRTAIVSLTVTEGGYPVDDDTGAFDPTSSNADTGSAFDVLVRGLARRRDADAPPLTVLSCDNVIGNGEVARTSTLGVAHRRDPELATWIDETVAFPNSMVDRITPATTAEDRRWLAEEHDIEDGWPVATEPFRQWVVEDRFAARRLPLEQLDVIITDDVEPYELFKLRLLNAGHSTLAYLARVAAHRLVHEVMAEGRFDAYLRRFLDEEAGPVVPDTPGIDLEEYKQSLVHRFSNPAINDQVDRLCQGGSSKLPKFLLPTVRQQLDRKGPVELSAFALAGWCRYLQGTDDRGRPIELADDPYLDEAQQHAAAALDDPRAFLGYERVFGSLADEERFATEFVRALELIREFGVRAALDRTLGEPQP